MLFKAIMIALFSLLPLWVLSMHNQICKAIMITQSNTFCKEVNFNIFVQIYTDSNTFIKASIKWYVWIIKFKGKGRWNWKWRMRRSRDDIIDLHFNKNKCNKYNIATISFFINFLTINSFPPYCFLILK